MLSLGARKRPTCCVIHVPQGRGRFGDIRQPAGLVEASAWHMALMCPGTPLWAVNAGIVPVECLQESLIHKCRVDVLRSSKHCHTGISCITSSQVRYSQYS